MFAGPFGRGFIFVAVMLLAGAASALAEPRTAIRGYDPVAYFTMDKPVKGDPAFSHVWDGTRYLFANAKHRDMFAADPDHYAPRFAGYCTAGLSKGKKVEANPENWVIADGALYVFFSQSARTLFLNDPRGVKSKAEANFQRIRGDKSSDGR